MISDRLLRTLRARLVAADPDAPESVIAERLATVSARLLRPHQPVPKPATAPESLSAVRAARRAARRQLKRSRRHLR